jgi:copper chaperone
MMISVTISVAGMTCQHCAEAINNALQALDGVESVEVSLESNSVLVEYENGTISVEQLKAAIEEIGYDVID